MPLHDASPTARALQCLGLIQSRPGITASQLAERLGVSARAVRRYAAILREADIPIDSASGPYGGYRVGRGVRMPPVIFSETEALALTMAAMVGASGDSDDPVSRGLAKLVQSLPGTAGEQASAMWAGAVAAPRRGEARPDPATSGALVAAVAARRRVRLGYRSASGSATDRTVDPWAVVARHGRWYLLCFDHAPREVRTYRLDRILHVEALQERFDPPVGLDPATAVEQHLGAGRRYATRVRFEVPLAHVRPFVSPVMGSLDPLFNNTACLLSGTTDNPQMYAGEWLAAIPLPFTVLGDPELVTAVSQIARRLTHASDSSRDP